MKKFKDSLLSHFHLHLNPLAFHISFLKENLPAPNFVNSPNPFWFSQESLMFLSLCASLVSLGFPAFFAFILIPKPNKTPTLATIIFSAYSRSFLSYWNIHLPISQMRLSLNTNLVSGSNAQQAFCVIDATSSTLNHIVPPFFHYYLILKSYLDYRTFHVQYGYSCSSSKFIIAGVLQTSSLSLLLFFTPFSLLISQLVQT